MVAVRAGVDEQLDAVVTDLDRQRVGVAVRGDGEEPVRAAVAAAPDLGPLALGRAQDVEPGIRERPGCYRRTVDNRLRRGERPQERAHHTRGDRGPPVAGSESGRTAAQQDRPGIGVGVVEDERAALVAVSLPWRMARHVEHGGGGVERSPEQGASPFVQRVPRGLRFHDGHQPQLGDEPVVVGGELAVDAARERVGRQLSLQLAGGVAAPRVALGEPWKGARRRQSAHGLGDDVVVRRRPAAPERREVLLVPAELGEGLRVVLEEVADARPVVEQPAHPHPAREPDTELDPARPVNAGQEGVARPPRAELGRNEVRVPGVAREPPRGREHGEVVVAGELPDRLDVARDLLVPVVDPERQGDVRGAPAGDGVEEPVGVQDVGPRCAEHVPVTGEQPVGGGNEPSRSLTGNQCTRVSRNRAHEHPAE